MKKAMMALAALCVAGAASAISFDWSAATSLDISTRDGTTGMYDVSGFSIDGTKSFAIKVGITFNTQEDADWFNNNSNGPWSAYSLLTLGKKTDGAFDQILTTYKYVTDSEEDLIRIYAKGAGSVNIDGSQEFVALAGTNDLVFAYDAATNTVTITYGDTTLATFGAKALPAGGFGIINQLYVDGWQKTDGQIVDSWAGVNNPRSWSVSGIQVATIIVPEPTALALLALGVAGLALRRKAA